MSLIVLAIACVSAFWVFESYLMIRSLRTSVRRELAETARPDSSPDPGL